MDIWRRSVVEDGNDQPFVLPLAPDRLHKDDVSGGPPYGVLLSPTVDATFVGSTTQPFVEYLNGVFALGGFPAATDEGRRWCRPLAADLLRL